MWHLDPPELSARDSWERCTLKSRGPKGTKGFGEKLRKAVGTAQTAADAFVTAARASTLHHLEPTALGLGDGIENKTITTIVYENGMVRVGTPGREIYDALMDAPEDGLCPLCKHSEATQLDHVMPKAVHPALCVAPQNLVPVCGICNHTKSDGTPEDADKVLLHPYYDHVDHETWLDAAITPGSYGLLKYFVAAPPTWDSVLTARVQHHFEFLELGKRYSTRANGTLRGMRHHLTRQLDAIGPAGVQAYLNELADSHLAADLNHWTGVAYRAWARDDAFCEGSFAEQPSPDSP
ncbi:hypothetical protein ABZW32_14935 [Streptomyces sp. NPDC004667]|uniref:HNH endonuclease n=1 Tax=Streptomyces sp. NPDC004667 TaxID=3154285 RepID=UPI0033A543A3